MPTRPSGQGRRILVFVFACLTCAISACASTPAADNGTLNSPAPTVTVPVVLPVTISLAGNFSRERLAALDELIARYENLHPEVRIEVVRAPKDIGRRHAWVTERLDGGDTSLDILVLEATWPAEMAAGGNLVPLQEQLEALGINAGDFLSGTIQANQLEGDLVGLPWSADVGLLYYRRDLLEAHGALPPANWDQLQQLALEIKDGGDLQAGYLWQGAAGEDLTCNTLEQIWSQGGDLIDEQGNVVFDSPQTISALDQMLGSVVTGASPVDTASQDDGSTLAGFRNSEAPFLRHWVSAWEYLDSEDSPVAGRVGIAPLPVGCLGGQSLSLSRHSLHPEMALAFMAYLAAYEQQAHMALAASQPPSLAEAYEDNTLLESAPLLQALAPALSRARPRPSLASYALISEVVSTEVNRMLAGEQDAQTTSANAQDHIESLIR